MAVFLVYFPKKESLGAHTPRAVALEWRGQFCCPACPHPHSTHPCTGAGQSFVYACWLSQLGQGGVCYWPLVGRSQECYLTSYIVHDSPPPTPQEINLAPNVTSNKVDLPQSLAASRQVVSSVGSRKGYVFYMHVMPLSRCRRREMMMKRQEVIKPYWYFQELSFPRSVGGLERISSLRLAYLMVYSESWDVGSRLSFLLEGRLIVLTPPLHS